MWTSTLDLSPKRVILTNLLGRFWRGAYFSSFAPLRVENTPRQPLPGTGWVRVRNRLAGICGSDLHLIYADGDLRVAPAALPGNATTYLGHEVVGEVIEIGDDVQQLQVGDRVVLQHGINCLSSGVQPLCRSCASGNYGLCERGTLPAPHPVGGGWSEEMLLHEQQLFRVPADMLDTQAVLLEPSAVALHAVLRHVPQAGDRVLIIGAGTIGLLTLQVVRALAPQAEISVQARYPFQVEKATRMGAAHIIYPQDSYAGVQQATQAQLYTGLLGNQMLLGGYDVIYDTIGTQKTIHNALRWARAKATVVLVGLSLHMMHIDLTPVWYQEINLIGTLGQGMETWPLNSDTQRSTFSIATDMIMHSVLQPEQLITHHFALNNYRQALLTAINKRDQRAIKVVFDYSLLPASVVPNVRASAASHRRQATVDMRMTSPLATKDLAQKEPVTLLSKHPVTPMPLPAPTFAPEPTPRIVPAPLVRTDLSRPLDPQDTPVGTDLSRPLPPPTPDEEQQSLHQEEPVDSRETARVSPTPTMTTETEHVGTDSSRPLALPTPDEEQQPVHEDTPVGTDLSRPLSPPTSDEEQYSIYSVDDKEITEVSPISTIMMEAKDAEETPAVSISPLEQETESQEAPVGTDLSRPKMGVVEGQDAMNRSLQTYDEEPLNDLEWLDVISAEQDMPEVQYVPDVADAPPLPEEAWSAEEPVLYDDEASDESDLAQEADDAEEPRVDEEETATNTSIETLLSTKTTKAINPPGRHRSKNKHKGKNITGSFRS